MYEALKSGKIGGYASDVMEEELVDEGLDTKFHSPLIECDNFIISRLCSDKELNSLITVSWRFRGA